jgi:hypothetical protein
MGAASPGLVANRGLCPTSVPEQRSSYNNMWTGCQENKLVMGIIQLQKFWQCCMTLRFIVILDLVLQQMFWTEYISETESASILRWKFGKAPTQMDPLETADLNHWTNAHVQNTKQWAKSKHPIIPTK